MSKAVGCRLASILAAEASEQEIVIDGARQKELLMEDEDEDFLDEATVSREYNIE